MNQETIGDPDRLEDKPATMGTGVDAALIQQLLEQGWSQDDILANYPQLERQDILDAIGYNQ